ncbi:hypothetical protein [Nocardioides montaniterrae]
MLNDDDIDGFLRTVARGRIVRAQRTYYDNIQQLPIEVLSYAVVDGTVAKGPTTDSFWAEIRTTTQLEGYDDKPVNSYDRWLFKPTPDGRRYLLASTTDPGWEESHDMGTQPWEVEHVHVGEYGNVLGIFDSATAADADRVLKTASDAKDDATLAIPAANTAGTSWGTVVYALSDQKIIDQLGGETVGDPDRVDGLTIAIPADLDDPAKGTAGYRVAFNPRVLSQPESVFARLARHEMTHATLRGRGDGAPLWLTEGVAEWVSVRPMMRSERRLPTSALTVGATATSLPTTADFAGPNAEAWYAVSWWVCEYIARTSGSSMLWTLLDRLAGGADQDEVIPELLGITPDQLVRRGVALMAATYRS